MRSLLIALTLFTASAALAQPIVLSVPNKTSLRVGMNSCDDTQIVTWTYNGATVVCTDLRLWIVAGSSCGDEPSGTFEDLGTVNKNDFPAQRTSTVTFKVQDLPGWTTEVSCGAADREDEYRVCASYKQASTFGTCDTTTVQKDDFELVYDSKPPEAPTIDNVAALDKALSVRVSTPTDASQLRLTVTRADGTGSQTITQSVDQPLFRVEDLENNVTYTLTATALDVADNESAASDPAEGTPILTRGFFDRYVEAGGQETGGCGAAAGGLTGGWVLAVLGFWLSSRRNRS
jgi:uncharacterized protein (TIGR03382 family)